MIDCITIMMKTKWISSLFDMIFDEQRTKWKKQE